MGKERKTWLIILVSSVIGALISHYLPENPQKITGIEIIDMLISAFGIGAIIIFVLIIVFDIFKIKLID